MTREFRLPDLGEGVHEGQIVKVHVKAGDAVREDQPLLEVETDKAAVEIPSPHTGTVTEVHVKEQQLVHVGDVMVTFSGGAQAPAAATTAERAHRPASAAATAAPASRVASPAPPAGGRRPRPASPAVRRLARELGVDLMTVEGSGTGGRVSRADVENAAAGRAATPSTPPAGTPRPSRPATATPPPAVVPIASRPSGRVPITQARKTIAKVMAESWATIPHVTDSHDADVTDLDTLRRGAEQKLTLLPFIVRAVVRALQRYPEFNASFDAEAMEIVHHESINIAVGVHTERGLIAPVIRDADRLTIPQIAAALNDIAEKARTASFAVNDTRGGTYTISNPGALGTTRYSTPIITPPQVAVLALGRARRHPWVVDGVVTSRLILPLSHSFDHRIIDGGEEVAFMRHVVDDLQNPARLLLEA